MGSAVLLLRHMRHRLVHFLCKIKIEIISRFILIDVELFTGISVLLRPRITSLSFGERKKLFAEGIEAAVQGQGNQIDALEGDIH